MAKLYSRQAPGSCCSMTRKRAATCSIWEALLSRALKCILFPQVLGGSNCIQDSDIVSNHSSSFCTDGFAMASTRTAACITSAHACVTSAHTVVTLAGHGLAQPALGISGSRRLLLGDQLLAEGCTSAAVRAAGPGGPYLLFTTTDSVLHTVSLTQLQAGAPVIDDEPAPERYSHGP